MGILNPKLSILPEKQRLLWSLLGSTPKYFVLYGGTALALRLAHRESVDFDFFANQEFLPLQLLQSISYLKDQKIIQQSKNTLSCEVTTGKGSVSVSFFGGLSLKQLQSPDISLDNEIRVASLHDIFGMKCATVPQRNETKDYQDIHALITIANITLSEGIAAAAGIYGRQYNPVLTLQALSYFEDLTTPLPENVKVDLLHAVQSVSQRNLRVFQSTQVIGDGIEGISP